MGRVWITGTAVGDLYRLLTCSRSRGVREAHLCVKLRYLYRVSGAGSLHMRGDGEEKVGYGGGGGGDGGGCGVGWGVGEGGCSALS